MTRNENPPQMMRVLVFEEDDMYVAQCLERNICVQAEDMNDLFARLSATIVLEASRMDSIGPAPDKFFDMWDLPNGIPMPVSMPVNARMVEVAA